MINLQKNVPLKKYSNYRIGGPAKYFVEIVSVDELKEALSNFPNERIFMLGAGAKVLIDDQGFDGLVIYNKISGIKRDKNLLRIGSGVLVKDILDYCLKNSLSGFEWAGGLPGTIGGAVRGNAGSFGSETKDNVVQIKSIDLKTLNEKIRDNAECEFGYRNSAFKSGNGINEFIVEVVLKFSPGDKDKIEKEIQEKISYRIARQPIEYPSVGSTFMNVPLSSLSLDLQKKFSAIVKNDPFPVIPATKLLALSGLKGKRIGGAMISDKQPNFIINVDNATAKDVEELINLAKNTVKDEFGLFLKEEVVRIK
jgi:UDP-N-acetylmuramate dehydrogenase